MQATHDQIPRLVRVWYEKRSRDVSHAGVRISGMDNFSITPEVYCGMQTDLGQEAEVSSASEGDE